MDLAMEADRTIYIEGLPLQVRKSKLHEFCGSNVELKKSGQPMLYIFEQKLGEKTASARAVFKSHVPANGFISQKNNTRFLDSEEIVHVQWYSMQKANNQVSTRVMTTQTKESHRTIYIEGLPLQTRKTHLHEFCGTNVELKENGQPMLHIYEHKLGKKTASGRVVFTSHAAPHIASFPTITTKDSQILKKLCICDGTKSKKLLFRYGASRIIYYLFKSLRNNYANSTRVLMSTTRYNTVTAHSMTTPAMEPNRTIYIEGLPLQVRKTQLHEYCGPNVELKGNGQPMLHIFEQKSGEKTASARAVFKSHVAAHSFISNNNNKRFLHSEAIVHLRWNEKQKANQVATRVITATTKEPNRTIFIEGLPLDVTPVQLREFCGPNVTRRGVRIHDEKLNENTVSAGVVFTSHAAAHSFISSRDKKKFTNSETVLRLQWYKESKAETQVDTPRMAETEGPNNTIFIEGLPINTSKTELRKFCGPNVEASKKGVQFNENKPNNKTVSARVVFTSQASAHMFISNNNNKRFLGSGAIVHMQWCKGPKIEHQPILEKSIVDHRRGSETRNAKPKSNLINQGTTFDCIVCFEPFRKGDMIGCVSVTEDVEQDSHYICRDCACRHAEARTTEGEIANGGAGLPCCENGCKRVILRAHVLKFLDERTASLLDKRMTSSALLGVDGIEYCKQCDYGELIDANTIQVQYFKCQNEKCKISFCRICKTDYHKHIGKKCDDVDPIRIRDKARLQCEEELSAAVIRICPKCKTQFQKLDGCNKMTCQTCKTTMCYLCRETGIGYDHFRNGGPCRQDNDANTFDEARLREIRERHQGTGTSAGKSRKPTLFINEKP